MSIITKQKFDAVVPAFRDATDSVYRKMVPQLELYENRTAEFAPYEKLNELRERYICLAAAHNAVRSLDLVLTGSGFGVISTAEKTPASQARVDALQRQLYQEASEVFDELRTMALTTDWNKTPTARKMVDSFLFTPTMLREYGVTCEEQDVYAREYSRLAPERHEGSIRVLHEISPELYEVMLDWLRDGGEYRTDDDSPRQRALKVILERGRILMAKDMVGGGIVKAVDNIRASLALYGEHLPEYTGSATYRARHSGFYQNETDHPTFFFS